MGATPAPVEVKVPAFTTVTEGGVQPSGTQPPAVLTEVVQPVKPAAKLEFTHAWAGQAERQIAKHKNDQKVPDFQKPQARGQESAGRTDPIPLNEFISTPGRRQSAKLFVTWWNATPRGGRAS